MNEETKNYFKELAEQMSAAQKKSLKNYLQENYKPLPAWDLERLCQLCEGRPESDVLSFNQVYKICKEVAIGE